MLRLPRGLTEAARAIIEDAGSRFDLDDQRTIAATVAYTFDTLNRTETARYHLDWGAPRPARLPAIL